MLITCTTCGTTIRVPDTAAGKRVKCPKCAAMLIVPSADDENLGISTTPQPPQLLPPSSRHHDEEQERPSRRRPRDDDDDRPSRRRRDEDDDDRPSRRRRDEDDDDDRPRRRSVRRSLQNDNTAMGVTSLVCGIVSFPLLCCCSYLGVVPAVMAIVFGIIGFSQGGKGKPMALTGLILGCVFFVLFLSFMVLGFTINLANLQNQQNFRFPR